MRRVSCLVATLAIVAPTLSCSTNPFAVVGPDFATEQFSLVPAGTFLMGNVHATSVAPQHSVTLTQPFYMQKTEVTSGQWRSVMGSDPSSGIFPRCEDDCPVESVSWIDVQEFIDRLNAEDPGKGYRLPTEAEWEYAARAGTTGDFGGTGVPDEMGNMSPFGALEPVARRLPNAWDLYDMHGNVWEWVQDWYDIGYYQSSPPTDPPGPATGTERVLRGGGWGNFSSAATSHIRRGRHPETRVNWAGFRLARTP